jgi:hypothetical protein
LSSILPEGEEFRRAVRWISEQLKGEEKPTPRRLRELVEEASLKFNLSPKQSEELWGFYLKDPPTPSDL